MTATGSTDDNGTPTIHGGIPPEIADQLGLTPDTGDGDVGDAGDAGDAGEESSPGVAFSVPKSVLNAIAENAKQAQVAKVVISLLAVL